MADESYGTGYESHPTNSAWQPEDNGSQADDERLTNRLDAEFMRRLLDVGPEDVDTDDSNANVVSRGPVKEDQVNDVEVPPSTSSEQVVDPEKLKSIFTSSNPGSEEESSERIEKKTLPYQLGGPPAENDVNKRQSEAATDDDDREFERLFERATNGDDFDDGAQREEVGRPLGVGREDVTEDILPDGTAQIIKHAYGKEVIPGSENDSDLSREWVAEKVDLNSYPTIVRKRSDRWMDAADKTPERFADENLARTVDDDVSQYLAYEDAEIDNLAKALDLATRSQLEKTDKYIPDEIRHLRQAIEYEGTLNKLRESAQAAESAADDNEAIYIGNVSHFLVYV